MHGYKCEYKLAMFVSSLWITCLYIYLYILSTLLSVLTHLFSLEVTFIPPRFFMVQHVHTQPVVTSTSSTKNTPDSVPSAADKPPVYDVGLVGHDFVVDVTLVCCVTITVAIVVMD